MLNLVLAGTVDSIQDLYDSEIHPNSKSLDAFSHEVGDTDSFDATLEETLHLITHVGVSEVYKDDFGEGMYAHAAGMGGAESKMNFMIDKLNGDCGFGYYNTYKDPSSGECTGFYAYDDPTCDYQCIQTEGLYWALTSLLGAQNYTTRMDEIQNEWLLAQPRDMRRNASDLVDLLEDHDKFAWLPRKQLSAQPTTGGASKRDQGPGHLHRRRSSPRHRALHRMLRVV